MVRISILVKLRISNLMNGQKLPRTVLEKMPRTQLAEFFWYLIAFTLSIKALFTAFYESVSFLPYRSNKLASLLTSPHSTGSYTVLLYATGCKVLICGESEQCFY